MSPLKNLAFFALAFLSVSALLAKIRKSVFSPFHGTSASVSIGVPKPVIAMKLQVAPTVIQEYVRFAILGHEAAHKLLFTDKRWNDFIGRWLVAYPSFVPLEAYRRSHFAHHKEEFGPNEPDINLYAGYPITSASLRRKLWRDARGTSGWKNLKGLLYALRKPSSRPVALRILAGQLLVLVPLALFLDRAAVEPGGRARLEPQQVVTGGPQAGG